MLQIYNSLKGLITPELISRASSFLGEDNSKVSSAISSTIPGILGALLHKGNSVSVENDLKEAGDTDILSNITNIFSGNMTDKQQSIGDKFLRNLLGTKEDDFNAVVASRSGIAPKSANRLSTMVAALVAGFLGNKLNTSSLTYSGLLSQLGSEKNSFLGMIPSGLASVYGITSLSNLGDNYTRTDYRATGVANTTTKTGGSRWWLWLLLILAIVLVLIWWRSCRDTNTVRETENVVVSTADTVGDWARRNAVAARDRLRADSTRRSDRERREVTLNDGTKLRVYRGGVEESLVNYLNSNDYKNASAGSTNDKWYRFDDIEFKFASSSEFMDNDTLQLNNLVNILKNYKDVKVKIGAYTDKVGDRESNMKLSKERADNIRAYLQRKGLGSQVVGTEGFGERFATHNEDDPDRQRAEDRIVAVQVVK